MKLSEMLEILSRLAQENGLSEPYIVGGIPRDKLFGAPSEIKDIDITTGDRDSITLGVVASQHWPTTYFKMFDDGHSSLQFKNIQLDFSNNYISPDIDKNLKEVGKENATDLEKEVYSRDFTINTILQPADLSKEVVDITGRGLSDVQNKILRTPINPEYTIGYDPRRILRGLKLALKYDLTIDPKVKEAMIKYRGGIKDIPMSQVKKQTNQMLEINAEKALRLLDEYKLLPIVPLSKLMTQEITRHHMVQHLLEGV